jgi:nucleoid-associated protein
VPALYTDRNQLKRYTRLYGRDQDLSISFSTAMLGRHITYDENTGTLTIRAIPKALKSQLTRHIKK